MKTKVFKLKYLAAACMALGASSAFAAATPTVCDAATSAATLVNTCTPEVTMYVAGSSALAGAITQVAPADLFDGTITKVIDAGGTGNSSHVSAWYGTAKSTLGTAAGKKLFVVYNNQNGSAAGISQLLSPIKDTTIPEQDVVTIGPMSKVAGVVAATQAASVGGANTCTQGADTTVAGVTYHNVTCTSHARTQADVGVTDVAPVYLFALEGAKPKALSTLTTFPVAIQGFAVGVNANLYNALQTQQIADGRIPSSCTAGDLTAKCQPSIRRADYASLASQEGSIKSAAALLGNSDTTLLELQRRDNLSGTQSSSNVFFLGNPCLTSLDSKGKTIKGVVGGELHPLDTTPDATKLTVTLNSTGGGVTTPLADATKTDYVIGVLGLNTSEPTRTATSWKYVKIDGVSPNFNADGTAAHANRAPFANGNYEFAVTSYAATAIKPLNKTSVVTAYPAVVSALITGLKDSTLHDLAGIGYVDGAADPSVLDGFNKQAHYIHTAGNSCSPLIKM
jgi:hypothetical protein